MPGAASSSCALFIINEFMAELINDDEDAVTRRGLMQQNHSLSMTVRYNFEFVESLTDLK